MEAAAPSPKKHSGASPRYEGFPRSPHLANSSPPFSVLVLLWLCRAGFLATVFLGTYLFCAEQLFPLPASAQVPLSLVGPAPAEQSAFLKLGRALLAFGLSGHAAGFYASNLERQRWRHKSLCALVAAGSHPSQRCKNPYRAPVDRKQKRQDAETATGFT